MAKLIVALSLLVGGANAMGIYGTGRPTAEPTGAPTAVCPPCTASFRLRRARRLPRAQVYSGAAATEITVSPPGEAVVQVRDPRPSRPPPQMRRNSNAGFGWKPAGPRHL